MSDPVLYTFVRCPYAIRARMALAYSGVSFEIREVSLKDKPPCMLRYSPKGTVPVLVLEDGTVIEESLEVISFALRHHDPDSWLEPPETLVEGEDLIEQNDGFFKASLDRYKYSARHLESPPEVYRGEAEVFLKQLESRLEAQPFLLGPSLRRVDVALFPFVRQFANVDREWFLAAPYPRLRAWLQLHLDSLLFKRVMKKQPPWREGDPPLIFGED